MRKIIAIMQPTYMPWMGYFSMIEQADEFVFLDSVQLVGRSWQVRNKIKDNNQERVLTIPIDKSHARSERMINNTLYANEAWKNNHLENIRHAYRKSPFFKEIIDFLEPLYFRTYNSIGDLNMTLISEICRKIGINTKFYQSSKFHMNSHKDDLLVEICRYLGADTYLSAQGSAVYIEKGNAGGAFSRQGISLLYLNYEHPTYPQQGEKFIPYIGIYDLLFNVGFNDALKIICKGKHQNYTCEEYRKEFFADGN